VSHVFPHSFQHPDGVRQRGAVEEPEVDVRPRDADVGKRGVVDAGRSKTIMHELSNIRTAVARAPKPSLREGTKFGRLRGEPRRDGGITFGCTGEP
jgi:hypothetical protein